MVIKTSALTENQPLRRRMHSLGPHTLTLNAASGSITSLDSTKDVSATSDFEDEKTAADPQIDLFSSEDETASEDDDVPRSPDHKGRKQTPPLPSLNTTNLPAERSHSSPVSPNSRAWYEFDLAVVVALVSPIGNWLTGGDHIKNLLLIVLLIFYLHQIIEVPWELYRKARPRKRSPNVPVVTVEDQYKLIATTELRTLEFFFLGLTAASPFLGALFLRYATAAVIGDEAVSWFSTALFVMATGMRPWSHLIDRFTQRTTDLHDVIHYPSPNHTADDLRVQMEEMTKRLEHLEKSVVRAKVKLVDATEDVYEYVDEAVNAVDRTVKRHERKYEKQEAKVKEIEQALEVFKGKGKQRVSGLTINTNAAATPSLLYSILPAWFTSVPPQRSLVSPTYAASPKHSLRSFPSSSSIQLETIPEEEAVKYPVLAQPANLASLVLSRAGYLATMPLRAVIRMVLRRY